MSQSTAEPETRPHDKEFAIVINGELAVVPKREVSWDEVVSIAFPTRGADDTFYAVTYRKAAGEKKTGNLVEGEYIEVKKEGTIFNVSPTGKS